MHKPDVLILDMALNDASGPSVCMQIRKSTSSIGIIGVTAYDPEQYVDDLAQAGAQALVAKERLAADLKKLLPVVAKGESSNPTVFMTTVQAHGKLAQQTQNQASLQRLSARELQVLRRYAHDASTAEIASELGVTANTVFTYMHRISQKTGREKSFGGHQSVQKIRSLVMRLPQSLPHFDAIPRHSGNRGHHDENTRSTFDKTLTGITLTCGLLYIANIALPSFGFQWNSPYIGFSICCDIGTLVFFRLYPQATSVAMLLLWTTERYVP